MDRLEEKRAKIGRYNRITMIMIVIFCTCLAAAFALRVAGHLLQAG